MGMSQIRSLDDLRALAHEGISPLCLYSGGLDGTFLLHFLKNIGCRNIIALTVDVGGDLDPQVIKENCELLGIESIIIDAHDIFGRDFVIPSIAAQSTYLGNHPICSSLSRPLMAKIAVETAIKHGNNAIIHTSNKTQNSLRRFNGALATMHAYEGYFGTPFEESPISREEKLRYLLAEGIQSFNTRSYSTDSNFWGREFESGQLDDPENWSLELVESLYQWTKAPTQQQIATMLATQTQLTIDFHEGKPKRLNGQGVDFYTMVSQLNAIAGEQGLGRFTGLEEIGNGRKVQEIREMPAAYVLLDAYRRLESASVSAECIREKMHIEQIWTREAVEGRWFGPLREASQSFIDSIAAHVTGTVVYDLSWRTLQVRSLKVAKPLYIRDRGEYESALLQSGEIVRA